MGLLKNFAFFVRIVAIIIGLSACQSTPSANKPSSNDDVKFGSGDLVLSVAKENRKIRSTSPQVCLEFWERLSSTTNFAEAVEGHFQIPPGCLEATENLVGKTFAQAINACLVNTGDNEDLSPNCLMELTLYRLSLIDHLSAEMQDYSSASSEMLFNRFVLRYMIPLMIQDRNADFELLDQQKILAILKVRFPNSPHVAKAQVMLDLLAWVSSEPPLKESKLEILTASITKNLTLTPEDEEVRELSWIVLNQHGQRDQLRHDLGVYMASHPTSKIGLYYQAQIAWDGKDRESCQEILANLTKRFPEDKRIGATAAALEKAKFGDKIFTANTSLSLN